MSAGHMGIPEAVALDAGVVADANAGAGAGTDTRDGEDAEPHDGAMADAEGSVISDGGAESDDRSNDPQDIGPWAACHRGGDHDPTEVANDPSNPW